MAIADGCVQTTPLPDNVFTAAATVPFHPLPSIGVRRACFIHSYDSVAQVSRLCDVFIRYVFHSLLCVHIWVLSDCRSASSRMSLLNSPPSSSAVQIDFQGSRPSPFFSASFFFVFPSSTFQDVHFFLTRVRAPLLFSSFFHSSYLSSPHIYRDPQAPWTTLPHNSFCSFALGLPVLVPLYSFLAPL
jgi:hypothetical protein